MEDVMTASFGMVQTARNIRYLFDMYDLEYSHSNLYWAANFSVHGCSECDDCSHWVSA